MLTCKLTKYDKRKKGKQKKWDKKTSVKTLRQKVSKCRLLFIIATAKNNDGGSQPARAESGGGELPELSYQQFCSIFKVNSVCHRHKSISFDQRGKPESQRR
jgi:hypothetical protein